MKPKPGPQTSREVVWRNCDQAFARRRAAAEDAGPTLRAAAGAVLAVLACLAADSAQSQASYPSALTPEALADWLRRAGDLAPEQVVAVSRSAATAIVARSDAAGPPQVLLRAEALTPDVVARTGLLSWEMRLDLDCLKGEVRAGATSGYPMRRADGRAVSIAPAQTEWRRPLPGTTLDAAWRAVCDAHYRPPLAAPTQAVAEPRIAAALVLAAAPSPAVRPHAVVPAPGAARAAADGARDAVAEAAPAAASARDAPLRAAQVVSSPAEADARRGLARIHVRFGEELGGRQTRIEPATVRGRTVYRGLVVGFASHGEARAFCRALKGRGQDCLAR